MENEIATIGHNAPPSKFDEIKQVIEDLFDEAKLWLDGDVVTTQEQADALAVLADKIRQAAKDAEALRKDEVKPLDEQKKQIQAKFNPLIGKTTTMTGKTVMALDSVKEALKPFLLEKDRLQREAAEQERIRADAEKKVADQALRDAQSLEEKEKAEQLLNQAKRSDKFAKQAKKQTATAKGEGRAMSLRSYWRPIMTDQKAAAGWAWNHHRQEIIEFVQTLADKDVRAGERNIDGFDIKKVKE